MEWLNMNIQLDQHTGDVVLLVQYTYFSDYSHFCVILLYIHA